ncbi:MAG: hypothetical protein CL862_14135 [Cyanobium sp. NAT70]|nr:hypothetical protein [Cyanobium sp. NAT70]|tara:strand:+ start:1275 stop:2252 length:978 start_codon:yes stop_codon:yes gene_type:complete
MKNQPIWPADEARVFLQAMKEVGSCGGVYPLEPITLELMEAIQKHVLHSSIDIDQLEIIGPSAYPDLIPQQANRQQLIQILILMPYVDMKVDPKMIEIVDEFASSLGVNPNTLKDLHAVRDNHLKRLILDYGRRSFDEFLGLDSPPKVIKGVIDAIHQSIGDPKLAEKYQTLESYPEASLGHTFFHWYRDRKWALPGEKKSTSELLVKHDCCHILGGFNTDNEGEMNVAAFQAGLFCDGFGFESLLEVILDFHLGKAFSTVGDIVPPTTGAFVPDHAMDGYEKGLACNVNLIRDLDFWDVANQQVVDLRERFAIPEISKPLLLKP